VALEAEVTGEAGPILGFSLFFLPEAEDWGASRESRTKRAAFAMPPHRLCEPASDLGGSRWVANVEAPGFGQLAQQHLYRTAAFLAEVGSEIQTELSWRDRGLFSQDFDVVFIYTTTVHVYRGTENQLLTRGYGSQATKLVPSLGSIFGGHNIVF